MSYMSYILPLSVYKWTAAAPEEETYLAFIGRRSPWRKPTWLFLGVLGRTTGSLARGENFCGESTWLFGSPHRGFWGVCQTTLPQRFGAFTWCLHLVLDLVPSLGAFAGTYRRQRSSTADQPTGKPSAVTASRFSGEQRLNAWGV